MSIVRVKVKTMPTSSFQKQCVCLPLCYLFIYIWHPSFIFLSNYIYTSLKRHEMGKGSEDRVETARERERKCTAFIEVDI